MKKIILLFSCAIGLVNLFAQSNSSLIYKRNALNGQLEVYQSDGISGIPQGQPIATIKKNVWGYLEIANLPQQNYLNYSTNPETQMPVYETFKFTPYQLPYKQIIEQISIINKRHQLDYLNENKPTKINSEIVMEILNNRSSIAKNYLDFYSSTISFPEKLKDGWYETVEISEIKVGYNYSLYVAKVENNKVVELYSNLDVEEFKTGYIFEKINLEITSAITKCKAIYRDNTSLKYKNLYFLDNIIEADKQIENPNFGFYSIYTANLNLGAQYLFVGINKSPVITKEDVVSASYVTAMTKDNIYQNTSYCQNSLFTLAIKETTERFSIGCMNLVTGAFWSINNFNVVPEDCKSTILQKK